MKRVLILLTVALLMVAVIATTALSPAFAGHQKCGKEKNGNGYYYGCHEPQNRPGGEGFGLD